MVSSNLMLLISVGVGLGLKSSEKTSIDNFIGSMKKPTAGEDDCLDKVPVRQSSKTFKERPGSAAKPPAK